MYVSFFFQAEDGIRDLVRSRGLGDVYKRQVESRAGYFAQSEEAHDIGPAVMIDVNAAAQVMGLSLIHI